MYINFCLEPYRKQTNFHTFKYDQLCITNLPSVGAERSPQSGQQEILLLVTPAYPSELQILITLLTLKSNFTSAPGEVTEITQGVKYHPMGSN